MAGLVAELETALAAGHLSQVFSSGLLSQVTWASCSVGSSQCKVLGEKGNAHSLSRAPHTHGFNLIFLQAKMCFLGVYLNSGNY